uniref:Integrase core domain containing protein n=1 Tax=Solanum tuberosum TaxID=4113 RepID=M1DG18_SOLTU
MVSRRITEEVGVPDEDRRLALTLTEGPVKLDMVRTNLTTRSQKKAQGITINEGGLNPPKRRGEEFPPRDKGKRKKHIAREGIAIETHANFSEPEDEQFLIYRRDELRARSQSTSTNIPSAATPSATNSVAE